MSDIMDNITGDAPVLRSLKWIPARPDTDKDMASRHCDSCPCQRESPRREHAPACEQAERGGSLNPAPGKCQLVNGGASYFTHASPIRWRGGKFVLSRQLIPLMPEHVCYCEPFAGGLQCFFLNTTSPIEVINDVNGELMNFYAVLARFPAWFAYRGRYAMYSRAEFDRLKQADPAQMSEEDRAWRFYYLNRCCFGGRLDHPFFGVFITDKNRNLAQSLANSLRAETPGQSKLALAAKRLRHAIIECRDWRDILRIYDRETTFFYLDPPYMGHENDYGKGLFAPEDFADMAERLASLKGKFLLSINDTHKAREIFGRFNLVLEPKVPYSTNKDRTVKKGELVFANYAPSSGARDSL